jgi:hypothetical protein
MGYCPRPTNLEGMDFKVFHFSCWPEPGHRKETTQIMPRPCIIVVLLSLLQACLVSRTASSFQIGGGGPRKGAAPLLAVPQPTELNRRIARRIDHDDGDVDVARRQSSHLFQSSSGVTPTEEGAKATKASQDDKQPPVPCPDCDLCDGSGRIAGGIGAVFTWIPIKAYRPCPNFVAKKGNVYVRAGQALDEIAFGRDVEFKKENRK